MEKVSVLIQLQDKISQGIKKVSLAFSEANKEISAAKGQTEKFNNVCSRLKMPDLNAQLNIVTQFAEQLSQLSEAGLGFGQSMADLSSITGIVGDDLKVLEQNSRKFGKEAGTGADVAARAYSLLASQITIDKIGIEGLNILEERSIILAQASGMALDAAANALAGTINQFGLSAEEADRVVNVLAAGAKYGAAEIEDLSMSFKVVGAAASAMGLNVESTAGALEILSQANLKGSEAGTALRNIILKLNTELGFDLSKTSLSTALDSLKPRLADAAYLSQVFGMENIAAAQFLIQNSAAVEEMTMQVTGTNVALEQASIRTETTAHKLEVMKAKVEDLKISISDHLGGLSAWMAVLSENAMTLMMLSTITGGIKNGIVMLNAAVVKLTGSTILHNIAVKASAAATSIWSASQRACTTLMALYRLAHIKLTAAIGSTTAATVALGAACTLGLSVAITGIVLLINKLCKKSSDAAGDIDNLKDSTEAFTSASASAKADIDMEVAALSKLIKENGDATDTVSALNQKYGEAFGQHKTAAAWYDTLITKSAAYCKQLGYEAQAKVVAAERAAKQLELDSKQAERDTLAKTVVRQEWRDGVNGKNGEIVNIYGDTTQSYIDLTADISSLSTEVAKLDTQFNTCVTAMADANAELTITSTMSGDVAKKVALTSMSYDELTKSIDETEASLKSKHSTDQESINTLTAYLEAAKQQRTALGIKLGIDKSSSGGSRESNLPILNKEAHTLKEINNNVDYYKLQLDEATEETAVGINQQIAYWEKLGESIRKAGTTGNNSDSDETPVTTPMSVKADASSLGDIKQNITVLQQLLDGATVDTASGINSQIQYWQDLASQIESVGKTTQKTVAEIDKVGNSTQSLGGLSSIMQSIASTTNESAASWLNWGAQVFQAIAQAIQPIANYIAMLTAKAAAETIDMVSTAANSTVQVAASNANAQASFAEANANAAAAATGAAKSVAGIPFAGPVLAVAAIASVIAAMTKIPKFADGGIAYGPTLGIFGEYAGAKSNPEVVAPLDRLRTLIGGDGNGGIGRVEFEIKGRTLFGVLERENNIRRRS